MKRYLLGKVQGRARERFESVYVEGSRFEELCAMEAELIDKYLRGALSWLDRRRFGRIILNNPARKKRVEEADRLRLSFAAAGVSPAARVRSNTASLALSFGLAMGMIALVAGVWRVDRTRHSFSTAEPPVPALLLVAHSSDRNFTSAVRVPIPDGARAVDLELLLEGLVPERLRVSIQNPEGQEVWDTSSVEMRHTDKGQVAVVRAPTQLLSGTDYLVFLGGYLPGGGAVSPVAYPLRIAHRQRPAQ